ncbi:MAG: IS701 family transposase [Pelatocladus maniniholoensis HA4357-MV3]|jgi:SRSO17 transposase|uniref:IS701 family transposase n=1 Tax=Pelatocladus maniniholoensis HA4357-MV3 TaxID=1117104 RepID=A0A9E3HCH0_9NOST|nr:IS701 family transposase [Pelatocladus maniniholoensis HA4357-MV3]BAZ70181.1 transposase [Fischerella sp. NIES-4106]
MAQPREAVTTITFIDNYCASYKYLFPEVRSFEFFKWLHLGLISDINRKSLPAIAKYLGLNNQALLHFVTESPWQIQELRNQRLSLIRQVLQGRSFTLIIDDSGDKKKGKTTDYVDRQYIGNLGTVENGIVSINAYAFIDGLIFPLIFKIFKPPKRLKPGETFKTKPQLIAEIIEELQEKRFKFDLVLADSTYGEYDTLVHIFNQFQLNFITAIRSNHGFWLAPTQKPRYTSWKNFHRIFSNGKTEQSYIREIIFGSRRELRYWQITNNKEQSPENYSLFLISNLPKSINSAVENPYGLITWLEYGCKHSKNYIGWSDFRITNYEQIERWWEIVCSVYCMLSMQFHIFQQKSNQQSQDGKAELIA